MYNAYTSEIDDTDAAVNDLTAQLKDKPLLKDSVGILTCYYEFVETGVVEAVCKALPFDVIGCVVFGGAVNAHGSMDQLSLTVLTADDVTFATAFSDEITADNVAAPIEKTYAEAQSKLGGDPALTIVLGPVMGDVSGASMLNILTKISGGVPVFGTLSNDTSMTYKDSYVFRNGEYHLHKMALLLVKGNIQPRFYTTAVSRKNVQNQEALVTASDGYRVKKINNMPVLSYFESIGVKVSGVAAVTMLPFLVDYGDGTEPAAYSMYSVTAEGALCGGVIPVGSSLAFAEIDYFGVMETAETAVKMALEDVNKNGANGIIAIPCFTRALVISPNAEDEINKSLELIGDSVPFSLLYSGGEICPVHNKQNETINRFHNLTYTMMVF
ncbi:MAG: FIST C-terminal domain-containing protein [Planctomycetaceae bacterium]|nr:FIST C-terminal domain-containing protein [Planctomycetaceae bacterium]